MYIQYDWRFNQRLWHTLHAVKYNIPTEHLCWFCFRIGGLFGRNHVINSRDAMRSIRHHWDFMGLSSDEWIKLEKMVLNGKHVMHYSANECLQRTIYELAGEMPMSKDYGRG
jgi:hypothetical protein